MDILTLAIALLSFGLFLLMHTIACRRMNAEDLFNSLWSMCVVTLFVPVLLTAAAYASKMMLLTLMAWACVAVLASLIHGILCFVYILCVFGPYETSVRMRLVREIFNAPAEGIRADELDRRYNNTTIVEIRLRRLTGSQYILEDKGVYRIGSTINAFFVFDIMTGILNKMIGKKQ